MLALSRKPGQSIVIPELGIKFYIYKVQGSTVQISIDAPKEIKILRGELLPRAGQEVLK